MVMQKASGEWRTSKQTENPAGEEIEVRIRAESATN